MAQTTPDDMQQAATALQGVPTTPILSDTFVVEDTPGGKGVPAIPGEKVTVRADPRKAYVAGGTSQWFLSFARALPQYIDDVTAAFAQDLYDRMLVDAAVSSAVGTLKAAILEDGVTLTPAIKDRDADGYDQAVGLVALCERMLSDLDDPGFDAVLWNMLDSIALGNKVAEQVYDADSTYTGKQVWTLKALQVKPRITFSFVVDAYLRVVGVMGRVPGQPFPVQQGTILADIKDVPNLLPRAKFAILTFRPNDGDPRGTSALRAAYSSWWSKQQVMAEYLKYLSQFASPSLIGTTAQEAEDYPLKNADGTYMVDTYGNPIMRSPEDDQLAALQAFVNGSAVSFPYGSTVKAIEMAGDGQAFANAFAYFDQQITRSVLNESMQGMASTRSANSNHKDLMDAIARQTRRPVERMVERDLLRTFIGLNVADPRALLLTPKATLGMSEQEDRPRLWNSVAALMNSGYLIEEQAPDIDQMVGLPVRHDLRFGLPQKETVQVAEQGGNVNAVGATRDTSATATTTTTTTTAPKPATATAKPGAKAATGGQGNAKGQ